jgi:hypothetical protein
MGARRLFLAVPLLFLVSCDQPTETESDDPNFMKPIPLAQNCYDPDDPMCLPGPSPDDPDPDAPGYFIGLDYNMDQCRQSNDFDDDGFDDNCEYRIARRFAPMLATHPGDYVSREPYWAATYVADTPTPGTQPGIKVMALFGYHADYGTDLPFPFEMTHSGDSEFVVLWITYHSQSKHWMTNFAFYASHHGETFPPCTENDFTGPGRSLEYPEKYLGYPRVWVAYRSHASSPTASKCDDGAAFGWDNCDYNVDDERVAVSHLRNLGSGSSPFRNCMSSENPISFPGAECFWQPGYEFCGWDLDRTDCATPYADHLAEFGFGGLVE